MNHWHISLRANAPVLLTMGDPAGIGPEIICRAMLEQPDLAAHVVVAGDVAVMTRARELFGDRAAALPLRPAASLAEAVAATAEAPTLHVWQACDSVPGVVWGRVQAAAGRAAAQCVEAATQAVLDGHAAALVTAPIHKEALAAAGVPFPGHTEMLQHLAARHLGRTEVQLPVRMMLSNPRLRTVLMSIHVSLRDALSAVTAQNLRETIRITQAHFEALGWSRLRVAVAGLNPHAGEGGLFGTEERDILAPVVRELSLAGQSVSGPHPPDTVFMRAMRGDHDVVIAMYHDQGLIPVKLFGLEQGVNTTLGLPFVRTSPDHGTAFDLAGQGRADAGSLRAAIEEARVALGRARA